MRHMRSQSRAGLSAWHDQLVQALQKGVQRADPNLADVVQLTSEILTLEREPGGLLDPRTPSTFQIADLRRPMRMYLYYRRHPLVVYAIPIGVLALAFFLGRASKRKDAR